MSEKARLAIIGAGGLTGKELLKLLKAHPGFEVVHITSNQVAGKKLSSVFPTLGLSPDLEFQPHSAPVPDNTTVVLATPNEVSMELAFQFAQAGKKVLDLSGVYRLTNQAKFEKSYKLTHSHFSLVSEFVFGLPELYREKIKQARLVSNPGCYATSAIVPLAILGGLRKKIVGTVIVDAKSGVSGAGGRTEEIGFSFTNTYENFRAYKILSHQHESEIEEYSQLGDSSIVFTPHLLPVYRGILSTIYITFDGSVSESDLQAVFQKKAEDEPFLRFLSSPEEVQIARVQESNFLDFGFRMRGNQVVLVSALDNLVKGASGQALQNLNLMHGFPEALGF